MDSMLCCVLEELSAMEARLLARIDGCGGGLECRVANSKWRTSYAGDPIFDVDLVVVPVFDTFYDNLDDGPVDVAPASDHAAFTMLKFANHDPATDDLADGPVFDTNPDDLDGGPMFDSYIDDQLVFDAELIHDRVDAELDVFAQRPDDLVAAHTGAIFDDDSLFDAEPEIEEVELVPYQADVTPPATTIDTPFTCSTKFLHLAVHAGKMFVTMSLQECVEIQEAWVLDPICRVVNTSCSSIGNSTDSAQGNRGGLLSADSKLLIPIHGDVTPTLGENRSMLSDSVETDRPRVTKCWDPGLADRLQFLELTASDPNSQFAKLHWVLSVLFLQQKCGGTDDIWVIAPSGMGGECQFKSWKSIAQMLFQFFFVPRVPADHANACIVPMLIDMSRLQESCQFHLWQFSSLIELTQVIYCAVDGQKGFGDLFFLLQYMDYHDLASPQLQGVLNLRCCETILLWGYQWNTFVNGTHYLLYSGC